MAKDFDGPDKRMGEDRREFCPMHMTQVQTLSEQKGDIRAIKLIISLFCVAALTMCGTMLWISMGIDKTFSNYMAAHKIESQNGFSMISQNTEAIGMLGIQVERNKDHTERNSTRIDSLEKKMGGI